MKYRRKNFISNTCSGRILVSTEIILLSILRYPWILKYSFYALELHNRPTVQLNTDFERIHHQIQRCLIMNHTSLSAGLQEENTQAPYAFKVVLSAAIFVFALVSFVGNILVSALFAKTLSLRNSTKNYYITSMAVSDLLYGVNLCGLFFSGRLSLFEARLSSLGCKLGNFFWVVSYSVSISSLVLISVDRFVATVFPFKVTMITGRMRAVFISLSWILPAGILSPFLYYSRVADEPVGPFLCAIDIGKGVIIVYNAVAFTLLYFLPFAVMIILNVLIVRSLRRTNRVHQGNGHSNIRKRLKQNQRITKVLISIISFFFFCWTAYYICIVLLRFFPTLLTGSEREMVFILLYYFLPLVSTAFNPSILFTFNTNYRQALKEFVRLVLVKCRSRVVVGELQVYPVENSELKLPQAIKDAGVNSKEQEHINESF